MKIAAAIRTLASRAATRSTTATSSHHHLVTGSAAAPRLFSAAASSAQQQQTTGGLPESITRIGNPTAFPNEYPGQNYIFNWALNADGVTPLKKAAFRITKPLDLQVAGLSLPKTSPLKVDAKSERANIPEAGSSDKLDFDTFDDILQSTKDSLSLSDALYCPEGFAPGSRTGVRLIVSNLGKGIVPDLVAYLDRAPKRDPKSQPVTCYILSGSKTEFAGYAIEEVEETLEDGSRMAVSVATVVITGEKPNLKRIVAGIELCVEGLEADAKERAEKKAAEEQEKKSA
ncbi:hypothetical protein ACHAWU_007702 [Discostella pseudostelligera]|uniref:Uncharacterized protein n=1 Tax=Discostella pseudostelligera TaxID=259834 RepID=A0ABD3M109_9STRA